MCLCGTLHDRASAGAIAAFRRRFKLGAKQPYLLVVGSRMGYKGAMTLYNALTVAGAGVGAAVRCVYALCVYASARAWVVSAALCSVTAACSTSPRRRHIPTF
jgi:hypothetical protein